jgi:hypothetical protein
VFLVKTSSVKCLALAITMTGLCFLTITKAEMCKWVDEQGCVHYAETCPEGVESESVTLHPPPSTKAAEEASKRFSGTGDSQDINEKSPPDTSKVTEFEFKQMLQLCTSARLSLQALARGLPVYYNDQGQLQAEFHQSSRIEYDRGTRFLDVAAVEQARTHWTRVEKSNCTPAVIDSGVGSAVGQRSKEIQEEECAYWKSELEYMERNKSFHQERLRLKKQYNAKCK